MTRVGTLEVMQDEIINLGSYGEHEDKDKDHNARNTRMTNENEDRDKDQGDEMGRNEDTRYCVND